MKKNKYYIYAILSCLFILPFNVNADENLGSYFCMNGGNFPINSNMSQSELENTNNTYCTTKWNDDAGIFHDIGTNVITLKNYTENYLNSSNSDVVINIEGNNTINTIASFNENQKWTIVGDGTLIIKKATVLLTDSNSELIENTTYDTSEGLLEYKERFINTNLNVTVQEDGSLLIGGGYPTSEIIGYSDFDQYYEDYEKYDTAEEEDYWLRRTIFTNEYRDQIKIPTREKGSPGYSNLQIITTDLSNYYLTIYMNEYIGKSFKIGNYFDFKFMDYANGEFLYKCKISLEDINYYNTNIPEKYFLILQKDGEKTYANRLYLKFESADTFNIDKDDLFTLESTTTGIKLDANSYSLENSINLVSSEITNETDINNIKTLLEVTDEKQDIKLYDITLYSNYYLYEQKVQPFDSVTISIPIPSNFDKDNLSIYRVNEDNTKVKYDVVVVGDYATFETDHFSNYVLVGNIIEEEYMLGDMNKDGKITITDVIKLLRVYLELDPKESNILNIGDMDSNGDITITDVILLLRKYLGLA